VKTGAAALLVLLFCVGPYLSAGSEETPAGVDSVPAAKPDTARAVIIQSQEEAKPQATKDRALTEDEAYDLVWNLPEVKKEIERILDRGGIPLSTVGVRPSAGGGPEGDNFSYVIRFQGVRAKDVMVDLLFSVNAFTGQVSVFDSSLGSFIPVDEWRHRKE